jgi:hypothetical protein
MNNILNWYIRVMMLLNLGANSIIVTLNERKTLAVPEYVLVLVNEDTRLKTACKLGTDLSEYPDRNNKFTLTLVASDPDPLTAELTLDNYGNFKYHIFEKVDADAFDFENINTTDLADITGEVEVGKAEYVRPSVTVENHAESKASIKAYK